MRGARTEGILAGRLASLRSACGLTVLLAVLALLICACVALSVAGLYVSSPEARRAITTILVSISNR
jgi:hypothetical protein